MSPRATLLVAALVALAPACLHAHGTDHELIAAATSEIAAHPDTPAPYLRRASLHLEHGDWAACLHDVDDAEQRQTEDLGVDLLRGRALAAGGHFANAKLVLDRFVAAHPGHPAALITRARVQAALWQPAAAADDFALAISRVPHPEPDQIFELVALLTRAGRAPDALVALDTALKTAPGQPALLERALQLEMALGRPDAALRRLEEVTLRASVQEPLLARRAALLAQAGRTREALAAWEELERRVASLPPEARGSHAMSMLALQAREALAALESFTQ